MIISLLVLIKFGIINLKLNLFFFWILRIIIKKILFLQVYLGIALMNLLKKVQKNHG